MKTKAVRLYGKNDLRLEEFNLPEIKDGEILAKVVTDSACMSTYKEVNLGSEHKKVPDDISKNPIIIGHEFCGKIIKVGSKLKNKFSENDKFVIQPNIEGHDGIAPGYSFRFIGGNSLYIIINSLLIENGSLLPFNGKSYFEGSLIEPLSCVVGAYRAQFHTGDDYEYINGIKEGGNLALLAATGPMGYLAIDYALNNDRKPKNIVVTGRTQSKIDYLKKLYPVDYAKNKGINLIYINTSKKDNYSKEILGLVGGKFDDVMVFYPSKELAVVADEILGYDGCINFFAGSTDNEFKADINYYDVHYNSKHVVGTSGGNTNDMKIAISLVEDGKIDVSKIVTHVFGLNDVISTINNLPNISGGKKLCYVQKDINLYKLGDNKEQWHKDIINILQKSDGVWSREAEDYILKNMKDIEL
ncbi:zinc-binding dehydrogenase [Anaerococcus hydrogenalis]|uniref:zinc-binding dehydrogenase n=1 Tax=Anaerococcus hydrogenalis TaxID=33029 RepID=UPI0023EF9D3D|nr:zinc-binding dehydrogenase [Anaerococcus hydrogenalis]